MTGKIYITSTGYDPDAGKPVKDPYLGPQPSLGICRPDLRNNVKIGDWFFFVTGSVPGVNQYVMGAFQVRELIHHTVAWQRFPERRLQMTDGVLDGNIILDENGNKHRLDKHPTRNLERRCRNYVVGQNPLVPTTRAAIDRAREGTLETLIRVFGKVGPKPWAVIGRNKNMTEKQVNEMVRWLEGIVATPLKKAG